MSGNKSAKSFFLEQSENLIEYLYGRKTTRYFLLFFRQEFFWEKYEKDYWAPTPGNAGYALKILLDWAIMNPDGVFYGD